MASCTVEGVVIDRATRDGVVGADVEVIVTDSEWGALAQLGVAVTTAAGRFAAQVDLPCADVCIQSHGLAPALFVSSTSTRILYRRQLEFAISDGPQIRPKARA